MDYKILATKIANIFMSGDGDLRNHSITEFNSVLEKFVSLIQNKANSGTPFHSMILQI